MKRYLEKTGVNSREWEKIAEDREKWRQGWKRICDVSPNVQRIKGKKIHEVRSSIK